MGFWYTKGVGMSFVLAVPRLLLIDDSKQATAGIFKFCPISSNGFLFKSYLLC